MQIFCAAGVAFASVATSPLAFFALGVDPAQALEGEKQLRIAEADDAEKQAFEAAKELGTIDAWEAFISNHSTGFYADLARAYVKKLKDGGASSSESRTSAEQAPTQEVPKMMRPSVGRIALAPKPSSIKDLPVAAKLPCRLRSAARSENSTEPARIRFINYGDDPIQVFWIDGDGKDQLLAEIKQDREAAVETFVTQPWLVSDADGNCIAIAQPNPGPQIFAVGFEEAYEDASSQKSSSKKKSSNEKKSSKKTKSGSCRSGQIRVEGKCMTKKESVSYCGPGYEARHGKCVLRKSSSPPAKPSKPKCPKGQVWSAEELCHYDD
ncbi:MAG: hypothetical protein AB7S74_04405 [Hyphomicrobium sp.]